jgi:hypothetical protein
MDTQDFKIYMFNLFALIITFSEASQFLQFCLTAVVVGYTVHKWRLMHLDRKERKKNNEPIKKNIDEEDN